MHIIAMHITCGGRLFVHRRRAHEASSPLSCNSSQPTMTAKIEREGGTGVQTTFACSCPPYPSLNLHPGRLYFQREIERDRGTEIIIITAKHTGKHTEGAESFSEDQISTIVLVVHLPISTLFARRKGTVDKAYTASPINPYVHI